MTIAEHIDHKANSLSLERLTHSQSEWLHDMKNLAMWAYIAKVRREMEQELKGESKC